MFPGFFLQPEDFPRDLFALHDSGAAAFTGVALSPQRQVLLVFVQAVGKDSGIACTREILVFCHSLHS